MKIILPPFSVRCMAASFTVHILKNTQYSERTCSHLLGTKYCCVDLVPNHYTTVYIFAPSHSFRCHFYTWEWKRVHAVDCLRTNRQRVQQGPGEAFSARVKGLHLVLGHPDYSQILAWVLGKRLCPHYCPACTVHGQNDSHQAWT